MKKKTKKNERNLYRVTNTLQDYGASDAGPSDCTDRCS